MANTIDWVEIPAADIHRACKFYGALFATSIQPTEFGGTPYAFLPGGQGAIAQGAMYKPGQEGVQVYLSGGEDLAPILARVEEAGGKVVQPKTSLDGNIGFSALFLDTEGNRIGLHSSH